MIHLKKIQGTLIYNLKIEKNLVFSLEPILVLNRSQVQIKKNVDY